MAREGEAQNPIGKISPRLTGAERVGLDKRWSIGELGTTPCLTTSSASRLEENGRSAQNFQTVH